ncbi:unnamed protein product [Microthlaspi erraticum]|uniref:Uncharacterized protein n=1 Tax=Microthlaspi erraticum TaxID=1685480 RepID=A0A6D2IWQ2_9BRAS|nr:unnamed protein product [Microthlaspi erraticum]
MKWLSVCRCVKFRARDRWLKGNVFKSISGNGMRAATGSYSNLFRVFGVSPGSNETATLEASRNPTRRHVPIPPRGHPDPYAI